MIWTIALGGLVLGGLVALVGAAQRAMVFPATRGMLWAPAEAGWDYQDVALPVDGQTTHGWYIPVDQPRGVILYSHGNGGNISGRMGGIAIWRDLGFDVLIYDYGGYGNSTGKPSERRCYKDIRAFWQWLTEERGVAPERVVLFGRSLGGAVAADLASEVTPGAVILESTFTSAVTMGKEAFPFFPVNLLLRHRFETEDKIGRVTAPLLIVHSPDDDIVPYHHGKALFEMAPEPKTFLEIAGNHNDGYSETGQRYIDGLSNFLEPLFPGR
ncbi:MAG TPA: alpha/beta hydrolase [Candidatus Hydrogenedentes bacterium]|nr:alpha/beta hydrolase [Candidatus Hydrogenedentota bacterium]HQM50830.1 alpha/beta hydrolase [Candidatus Hydrogenedentota bacterium]